MKAVAGRGQRAGDGDGCTAEAVEGAQSRGEPRPGSCGEGRVAHRPGLHCTCTRPHTPTHAPAHTPIHAPAHLSWLLAAPIPALLVACCARQQLAHVVAGWSTIGPPRELAVLHVASTSVLRHQGRVARCLQEAVSRKSPGARHAAYLARAWVGVRSKSAASVVCVRAACCCSICPSGCRSAGWPPGAAARGAASRARGASGAAGRGRGTTRPSTSGGAHQAAAPHGLSPEVGAA